MRAKAKTRVFGWGLGLLLVVSGMLPLPGCCPYSRGLVLDVNARTESSAARAFGFALGYLSGRGYRIWQEDLAKGYIRGSIERDSVSLGSRIEDVLSVSITDTAGGAQFQISAETYRVGPPRVKVRVSKEAREDASLLEKRLLEPGDTDSTRP